MSQSCHPCFRSNSSRLDTSPASFPVSFRLQKTAQDPATSCHGRKCQEFCCGWGRNRPQFPSLAPGFHVAVEAVVGQVDLASDEPLSPGNVPLEHTIPFLEPVEIVGDPCPELLRLLDRFLVQVLVLFERFHMSFFREVRRTLEFPVLLKKGINAGFGG